MNEHKRLSAAARERAHQPRNYGPLPKWNGHARITGSCGDTMEFWIEGQEERIASIGFTTNGCGTSRAAGSMASELAYHLRFHQAADIAQADILYALGGLPAESEHCALLAISTLRAAIADAQHRRAACASGTDRPAEAARSERTLRNPRQRQRKDAHGG
jgi:nitrogen fixation NifU-like protein